MRDLTEEEFRNFAKQAITEFSHHPLMDVHWESFAEKLTYIPQSAGSEGLGKTVRVAEEKLGGTPGRLHYLSVPPSAAPKVINTLREAARGTLQGRHGEALRHQSGERDHPQ